MQTLLPSRPVSTRPRFVTGPGTWVLAWALAAVLGGCGNHRAHATPPGSTGSTTQQVAATPCPAVGAIRWDAWFGGKGEPGKAVERSLGPERWHARLPACARVQSADKVQIACDSADQMAREIEQASLAGITYWAFVTYTEDDPMNSGLQTYLQSPAKSRINFALISELSKWGNASQYRTVIERYSRLLSDRSYQKTSDGRPIFFLGFVTDEALNTRFGGRAPFAKLVQELRQLVRNTGQGNPYIVLLDKNVSRAKGLIRDLDLDAISAYAVADNNVRFGEYKQLTTLTAAFWAEASAAGLPLLPTVMTGWDRRPRVLNPVPWEGTKFSDEQMERFFKQPTPAELEAHLAAGMRQAMRPTPGAAFQSVLVYAWNEFDEGGWLAPTLGEGNARLDAVRRAVGGVCPRKALN